MSQLDVGIEYAVVSDPERSYSAFEGGFISSNALQIPGITPHEKHNRWEVALLDESVRPTISAIPFSARNGIEVFNILRNPENRGHLLDTAWGYDAVKALTLESVPDIKRLHERQVASATRVGYFAIVLGPHYDESTGFFGQSDETIGVMTHIKSIDWKNHVVALFLDKSHSNSGLGTRVLKLMQWSIFKDERAEKMSGFVHDENAAAVWVAEKVGMDFVGTRNEAGIIRLEIDREKFLERTS